MNPSHESKTFSDLSNIKISEKDPNPARSLDEIFPSDGKIAYKRFLDCFQEEQPDQGVQMDDRQARIRDSELPGFSDAFERNQDAHQAELQYVRNPVALNSYDASNPGSSAAPINWMNAKVQDNRDGSLQNRSRVSRNRSSKRAIVPSAAQLPKRAKTYRNTDYNDDLDDSNSEQTEMQHARNPVVLDSYDDSNPGSSAAPINGMIAKVQDDRDRSLQNRSRVSRNRSSKRAIVPSAAQLPKRPRTDRKTNYDDDLDDSDSEKFPQPAQKPSTSSAKPSVRPKPIRAPVDVLAVNLPEVKRRGRKPELLPIARNGTFGVNAIPKTHPEVTQIIREQDQEAFLADLNLERAYPAHTFTPALRENAEITRNTRQEIVSVHWKKPSNSCIFCSELHDEDGGLPFQCHGCMLDQWSNVRCPSHFHVSCAKKMNADRLNIQYGALRENQNGVFCPDSMCSMCSVDGLMQTAFADDVIPCALCHRGFHSKTCLPVGSTVIDVTMEGQDNSVKMVICPSHFPEPPAVLQESPKACWHGYCGDEKELTQCASCPRQFCAECIKEIVTLNGEVNDRRNCEFCACKNGIRIGSLVLGKMKGSTWKMAYTRKWTDVNDEKLQKKPNFNRLGFSLIEFPLGNGKESFFDIAHVSTLLPLSVNLSSVPRSNTTWEFWHHELDRYQKSLKSALPSASKLVYKFMKRAVPVSQCVRENGSVVLGPPTCTRDGNCSTKRCIHYDPSKSLNGPIPRNMKLQLTEDHRGLGVFCRNKSIAKGERLGEYAGELLTEDEYRLRKTFIGLSGDAEAMRYMMELSNEWCIDAAAAGNMARYFNHHCDPNAEFREESATMADGSKGKRGFIYARREIQPGEEITFDYKENFLLECQCKTSKCRTLKKERARLRKEEAERKEQMKKKRQLQSQKRKNASKKS